MYNKFVNNAIDDGPREGPYPRVPANSGKQQRVAAREEVIREPLGLEHDQISLFLRP